VISPRTTRLVRVDGLHAFRDAVVTLATAGAPEDARDRLVVVPTRAAALQLVRALEDALLDERGAVLLPDLITPDEIVPSLAARLEPGAPPLTDAEREVLLGVACRAAAASGAEPPFRIRAGLVADALRFYDSIRRQQKDVDTFERLALGALEPGASYDRGAERLARQTRFLVAAFREFERRASEAGADEHALRHRLVRETAALPVRDVVLTVTDRSCDPYGLWPADWDLLTRIPGLEQLTIVVTDGVLAGALHERLHDVLPGIEETRFTAAPAPAPLLVDGVQSVRDREEEVALFARRVRHLARGGHRGLDRHALVVRQPLPYVYIAREVLRAAGIPCQTFDALPLAGEPYAAALDLVLDAVGTRFARVPSVALLRSPHFSFTGTGEAPLAAGDVAALDRALSEAGYLGEIDALERLVGSWRDAAPRQGRLAHAAGAGGRMLDIARELARVGEAGPMAPRLDLLLAFLRRFDRLPGPDDPLRERHLRARTAVRALLAGLRDAFARFDDSPVAAEELAALVRRWIEARTFAPRAGDSGVHLVDAESARFGSFDHVHIAGLVDGEWPERPHRNIFYSPAILRDLGWPQESARADAASAAFADLLRLPSSRLVLSAFSLEADTLVTPSPLLDDVDRAGLDTVTEPLPAVRIFDDDALMQEPLLLDGLGSDTREWALRRQAAPPRGDRRFLGSTAPFRATAYSLSGLERYQDCPFRFFASQVLRLPEPYEDGSTLSPRARGRFIHEVFQRFFEAWDDGGGGTIDPARMDAARQTFAAVAEPLLAALPPADAALERTRLFGSAISVGIVDVVLGLEASRPVTVKERWLEYRLEGEFTLGAGDGRSVSLRGVADRIDLLEGRRLRVIDYKSGLAPSPTRALQVPIYALCAQERLMARDLAPWAVDEAAYVAFSGRQPLAAVVKPGSSEAATTLDGARERLFDIVEAIGRGEFMPRPHDRRICNHCAYPTVCRKDDVGD
jgi:RecB family exonuclease/inactivated superfamily I helicase